jgi:hypothetical protein
MKSRDLALEIIRFTTASIETHSLRRYAAKLPIDVAEAAKEFTVDVGLGPCVEQLLIENNVSVPYELYAVIDSRQQAENESTKEVTDTSETK